MHHMAAEGNREGEGGGGRGRAGVSLEQLENEVVREERKMEKAVCEGDKKGGEGDGKQSEVVQGSVLSQVFGGF